MEVIEGGGEEEDSEPSSEAEAVAMAEKLNDRRVQLAGFLKLVLFGVLEMNMAAPVFAQYVKVSDMLSLALPPTLSATSLALPSLWRPIEDGVGKMSGGSAYPLVQDHCPLLATSVSSTSG